MRSQTLLKYIEVCLILLAVSACPVPAQESAPKVGDHLKLLGFALGKSTLVDVQARFGKTDEKRCSGGEDASVEVCYVSAENNKTEVIFEAGFSGGWTQLDGFKVISNSLGHRCNRQCSRVSQVTSAVQTEGGLKLGMTHQKLVALLGVPKDVRGSQLRFEWHSRQAMTKEQQEAESKTFKSPVTDAYYDVQDTIEVTLADSKVVEFAVHHIVTY